MLSKILVCGDFVFFIIRYFIIFGDCDIVEEEEKFMYLNKVKFCMVYLGWIWGGDFLRDFVVLGLFVYFCCEVIVWGDSVKFWYGKGLEDVLFFWDFMLKYVKICVRWDNG